MQKLKEQGRDMQTSIDDSGIFYRGIEKRASFPLVLVGAPRKGQALGWVTPWIALGFPTHKWVSGVPFDKPLRCTTMMCASTEW